MRAKVFLWFLGLPLLTVLLVASGGSTLASDHDDTDLLKAMPRHEARITDLFAFTRGDNLVLILCTNPTIPKTASAYRQPSDLTVRFFIDSRSKVSFDDPVATAVYGGSIKHPGKIAAEHTLEVTFDAAGTPSLRGNVGRPHLDATRLFAGLRDDPFIRGPRLERNVAALVIETPLKAFTEHRATLVIWAATTIPSPGGSVGDLGGRSLRSQFAENMALNDMPPADHYKLLGVVPDVVIYDTSRPAAFPNGRALEDDVVDLVGDARILATDAPFPSVNDRAFQSGFPYLAEPHAPCGAPGMACCAVGPACGGGSTCVGGTCAP